MLRIAIRVVDCYDVESDVVLAGCVLHDMGKAVTFDPLRGITDDEWKVGHIVRGVELLNRAADVADLDDDSQKDIKHAIVSHHGKKEWGSPREPQTPEAHLVHLIDQMDSTMDEELD